MYLFGVINDDDLFLLSFIDFGQQISRRIFLGPATARTDKTTALIFKHSSAL